MGPNYLEVLGVAPAAGREFARGDGSGANPGAVINQHFAETLWPGRSAIGRSMLVRSELQTVEVVGVTPDGFFHGFRSDPHPNFVFRSEEGEPDPPGETTFYIRYAGSLDAFAPTIGRAVRDVDTEAPLVSVRTMDTQLDSARWPVLAISTLLGIFAIGSLTTAAIGPYAVVTFSMRRRTRDFGVRMALGASSTHILRAVVGEGLGMTAAAVLIGFALSLAGGMALRSMLYGVSPIDGRTYLGVFGLLTASSLCACYLPARRATRIDPMDALRQE